MNAEKETLSGRCKKCGRYLDLNDAYYDFVDDGYYVSEFCDDCHDAHITTEKLERGEY